MATGFENILKNGVRVIVRTDWQWDQRAPGSGQFVTAQGVIEQIGDTGLVLRLDNTRPAIIRAYPFTAITHIDVLP